MRQSWSTASDIGYFREPLKRVGAGLDLDMLRGMVLGERVTPFGHDEARCLALFAADRVRWVVDLVRLHDCGYLSGYGADDVSELASISAAVFTMAIGVLAIISLLRRGSERADDSTSEDEAGNVSDRSRVDVVRSRIWMLVTHPFRSIKRDPIRWSAILGAVLWPTVSLWSIYALLPQGIAMACLVRYADTYKGSPSVRIVALVVATLVVWSNFAVTVPFTPLAVAWVGPALTLWTFSAVSAMFRPRKVRDGLPSHQGSLDDLDEEDADVAIVSAEQSIEKV